ncbi:MAG: glyceraldehyde 3-phosphate dehydrogenase NAD-binding domain-containing protein, partial [Halobaculum sp.]
MTRIGINGFGRIGRAVTRIVQSFDDLQVVAVNDIDPNVENHAYLLAYDSVYGRNGADIHDDGRPVVVSVPSRSSERSSAAAASRDSPNPNTVGSRSGRGGRPSSRH